MTRLAIACLALLLAGCGGKDGNGLFPVREGLYREYAYRIKNMDIEIPLRMTVLSLGVRESGGERVAVELVNGQVPRAYRIDDSGVWRLPARFWADEWVSLIEKYRAVSELEKEIGAQTHRLLPFPPEQGTTWEDTIVTEVLEVVIAPFRRHFRIEVPVRMRYRIEAVDERVSVPAGNYSGCIRVHGSGSAKYVGDVYIENGHVFVEQDEWYCPGVGLTRAHRLEKTDTDVLKQGTFDLELVHAEG
ncbi:MAG: hypothetical protein D6786_08330 [Gammaproteobacteria bacterium]|nr:MAG: hypothetical protein D6786_08330 [Gammaproteobacteria bacterium]